MLSLIGEPHRMLQVRSLEDTQVAVAQITRSTKQVQKASQIFQISSHQKLEGNIKSQELTNWGRSNPSRPSPESG